METTSVRPYPVPRSIILHVAPGAAIAAFVFLLTWAFSATGIPSMFWLQVGALVVGTPLMLFIMKRGAIREGGARIGDAIAYRAKLRWWEYILWPFLMLAAAAGVMTTVGKIVNPVVQAALFGWLPPGWDFADYLKNPTAYTRAWLIVTWALGFLITTIWFPVMEELYFRGFLLPRIGGGTAIAAIAGAVLFACYHLFSPWMIPARIVALLPFVWLVRWKKDVRLGIIAHVALNLVGDTISSIPIVFG